MPDLEAGRGGLLDLHALRWLEPEQDERLIGALDFLLRALAAVEELVGQVPDRLSARLQERLAAALSPGGTRADFLAELYRHARWVAFSLDGRSRRTATIDSLAQAWRCVAASWSPSGCHPSNGPRAWDCGSPTWSASRRLEPSCWPGPPRPAHRSAGTRRPSINSGCCSAPPTGVPGIFSMSPGCSSAICLSCKPSGAAAARPVPTTSPSTATAFTRCAPCTNGPKVATRSAAERCGRCAGATGSTSRCCCTSSAPSPRRPRPSGWACLTTPARRSALPSATTACLARLPPSETCRTKTCSSSWRPASAPASG